MSKTPTPARNRRQASDHRRSTRAKAHVLVEALDPRVLLSGDMHAEHMAAIKLVPVEEASHVASSGNWSKIWGSNRPGEGAEVLIPKGVTVTVDDEFAAELEWIRVDGTLQFATDRDASLRVETIVVSPEGRLRIGTAADPIAADARASITFVDQGPIDRAEDPLGVGRGLVDLSGHLSIYGAETTSFVDLAAYPRAGDTVLRLKSVPTNWEVGGRVVVAGTTPDQQIQDEELRIVAIRGAEVTVDRPLAFDHALPTDVSLPLAYLDRNVVLTSENIADPGRRGHIMVMSGGDHHVHLPDDAGPTVVAYAMLGGLGRTRADMLVTDPELNDQGNLLPPRDAKGSLLPMYANQPGVRNDRGRYSLHFHQNGTSNSPSLVKGVAVADGLKWGVVNHESNVVVEDSVSYRVDGAAFATESGSERGAFRHNYAIRSFGSRGMRKEGQAGVDIEQAGQKGNLKLVGGTDWGFQGYGFWMQGPLVAVEDNIAAGHAKEGFAYTTSALMGDDVIPATHLPTGARGLASSPTSTVRVDSVPFIFSGNTAFGSRIGLGVYNHFGNVRGRERAEGLGLASRIEDSTFANVKTGFIAYYASNMVLEDVRIVNEERLLPLGLPKNSGSEWYGDSGDITWDNVSIENFRKGIDMPRRGNLVVRGGHFRNPINIFIDDAGNSTVTLEVGDTNFEAPSPAAMEALSTRDDRPWNIYMASQISGNSADVSGIFRPTNRSVFLDMGGQPERIYFPETGRGYRFDSTGTSDARTLATRVPASIRAMTAGELWDQYHLAVNGAIAPEDARVLPGIYGVVSASSPPASPTQLALVSDRFTTQLDGYILKVRTPSGEVIDLATTDLTPNTWNLVTGYYKGEVISQLIYAQSDAPTIKLTDSNGKLIKTPTTITTASLESGYTVYGKVYTKIGSVTKMTLYTRTFTPEELAMGEDGVVRVTLTFMGLLGVEGHMNLALTVVEG